MSTMHEIPLSLRKYLDEHSVKYEVIPHPRDYTAQMTAADTRTRGREFAKCVLVWIDNFYAMVVLPADHRMDFRLLRGAVGGTEMGLVREEEMARLFPDCEIGAESPFGNLYDLPVYVAKQISDDEMITFNAGTHEEAIRMEYREFEWLVGPQVIDCARKG